jgi:hypothetical protein
VHWPTSRRLSVFYFIQIPYPQSGGRGGAGQRTGGGRGDANSQDNLKSKLVALCDKLKLKPALFTVTRHSLELSISCFVRASRRQLHLQSSTCSRLKYIYLYPLIFALPGCECSDCACMHVGTFKAPLHVAVIFKVLCFVVL